MRTIAVETQLIVEDCCNCSMLFGMPADFRRRMKAGGEWFGPLSARSFSSSAQCDQNEIVPIPSSLFRVAHSGMRVSS